jgi:hypothetical protein
MKMGTVCVLAGMNRSRIGIAGMRRSIIGIGMIRCRNEHE